MAPVLTLAEVDSTNSALLALSNTKALPNHFVLRARNQTDGKGQQDSRWFFHPGSSLAFSYLYKPECLAATETAYLSMAVSNALLSYLQTHTKEARIKWPNDLYIRDKKVCGVLIQNHLSGKSVKESIIGIGINVKRIDFPAHLPHAASLEARCGSRFDPDTVFESLLPQLRTSLQGLDQRQLDAISARYVESLYLRGQTHSFRLPCGRPLRGKITGVNPSGELQIRVEDGPLLRFKNKAISFS